MAKQPAVRVGEHAKLGFEIDVALVKGRVERSCHG